VVFTLLGSGCRQSQNTDGNSPHGISAISPHTVLPFFLLAVSVSTFAANVIVAVAVRKRTEVPAKELPADFPGQRVAIF
jgi:hypothetical protein